MVIPLTCRRDGWHLHSSSQVWELLVAQTKRSAKDHHALADIYTSQVMTRCQQIAEDLQNTYRKVNEKHLISQPSVWAVFFNVPSFQCREIGYEIHEEVLKVLYDLHTAMKTHHTYQSEFRLAESKLQVCLSDSLFGTCTISNPSSPRTSSDRGQAEAQGSAVRADRETREAQEAETAGQGVLQEEAEV